MIIISVILYVLAAIALVSLIICIWKLVTSFTGWNLVYNASIQQMEVDIPKADNYSICIRSIRYFFGRRFLYNMYPTADFEITRTYSGEQMPFHKSFGPISSNISQITVPIGYFYAPDSNKYLVTNLNTDSFSKDEVIVIRKHISTGKFVMLIVGIVGSSLFLIAGVIIASLILAGVI